MLSFETDFAIVEISYSGPYLGSGKDGTYHRKLLMRAQNIKR